jgi:L-Ala-D/L-Glu epimerase
MRITDIVWQVVHIPLTTTFRTALRTVDRMDNVIVTVQTDSGEVGYGCGAPATVITGDTIGSICSGVEHLRDQITGMDVALYEPLLSRLHNCIVGCTSAKAAVDMALYDLLGKMYGVPLYRLLGGMVRELTTDITISLDTPENMVAKARERIGSGFATLKIKVGGDPDEDLARLRTIRSGVGEGVNLRIDANQGWTPKQAVYVGRELEKAELRIELMEQPVKAEDFEGLRFVRERVALPVFADESCFSPADALRLVQMGAVDGINIKLMKCGGIYNALKIAAIAEAAHIPCMIGSMMESHISVAAAAHLAASKPVITALDLDAPLFCSINPADGGMSYDGEKILLPDSPGLGIDALYMYPQPV